MGLTDEIRKGLDVDLERRTDILKDCCKGTNDDLFSDEDKKINNSRNRVAAAVDKGICNGAYDIIFSDESETYDEGSISKSNEKEKLKKEEISSIYGPSTKTLEIRSQLEKIIDMINHTDPDCISIDIRVKTLTSKQRYKHKGTRAKISIFE